QFLDYFNLKNLDQLPALAEIRDLETLNAELGFNDPLEAAVIDAGLLDTPAATEVEPVADAAASHEPPPDPEQIH
ncbi:MAG: SMC-Scp complex subunit ScpB, partial [Haliea sp.]